MSCAGEIESLPFHFAAFNDLYYHASLTRLQDSRVPMLR